MLVVYDHLIAVFLDRTGRTWLPLTWMRTYVTQPLGIIQDFGFLGVAIFFLISGFIITHVAQREDRFTFAVKRLGRIYPPLFSAIFLIIVFELLSGHSLLSLGDYLWSLTLLNYWRIPQVVVSGVAWTLVIEVIYYALVFAVLPILRDRPALGYTLQLLIVGLVIRFARSFGDEFFLASASVAYLPYLLHGSLAYFLWKKRISPALFGLLGLATYLLSIYGIMTILTDFYAASNSYSINFLYAYAIFGVSLLLNDHVKLGRITAFLANISYSLYLVHGTVGFYVLAKLTPHVNYAVALVVATAVALGTAYLSWRFVEVPSQSLTRRFLKWIARIRSQGGRAARLRTSEGRG